MLDGPGEGPVPVPHPARFLVAALTGVSGHPLDQGIEQQRRVGPDAVEDSADDRGILLERDIPGARAQGHTQLIEGTAGRTLAGCSPASANRDRIPDRSHHQLGRLAGAERAEIGPAVLLLGPGQREAGKRLGGELHPVR